MQLEMDKSPVLYALSRSISSVIQRTMYLCQCRNAELVARIAEIRCQDYVRFDDGPLRREMKLETSQTTRSKEFSFKPMRSTVTEAVVTDFLIPTLGWKF